MIKVFSSLRRMGTILKVVLKYRLDTLVPNKGLPPLARFVLAFVRLLPAPTKTRGQRLRLACEELGPIFIKFGQLLSTRPDFIPDDIIRELDRLQDNVPPFAVDDCVQVIEDALGAKVDALFKRFDREPLASASVAQVHSACLDSGNEVVVKVIRPGIDKIINKDIQLMHYLARWVQNSGDEGKRLRPLEVVEEYRHTITNELNLQREAANASQLRRNFAQSPLLYVPEVHWPYVRDNVMVMERIYGAPVTDLSALNKAGTNLKVLAERGVEIFFTQVFDHNFFHADMHPGNIFVDCSKPDQPHYIALDMAIVTSLNREDQYYLARNLLAMFRRDYRQMAELYVTSGWVAADTNINDFEAAIRAVCEPIFERPLKDISFAQVLINLFQTARRFDMTIQPQLVLLQKTLFHVEGLGRQLYPDLDLWSTAHPFLERWLKERFRPKTLLEQLRRYGPEWMEKFPQIPQLVLANLEQLNQQQGQSVDLAQQAQATVGPHRKRLGQRILAGALAATGLIYGWPELSESFSQLSTGSGILIAAGAILWLIS